MAFTDPINLVIILGIVAIILIWGPKKVPELARSIGRARREFHRGETEPATQLEDETEDGLIRAAHAIGVATEGKSREQIANEVQAKLK